MSNMPAPVQNLIDSFSRLPGIGPRSASRLAFFLLKADEDICLNLAHSLTDLKTAMGQCKICFNITLAQQEICAICADKTRADDTVCVVQAPMDVIVLEQSGAFSGRYHVLHGVLSPIEGVNPKDIRLDELFERVRIGNVREVIIATNPSMEGDATAMYIQKKLASSDARITRLARGLPVGGELEYADANTLLRALSGRQEM